MSIEEARAKADEAGVDLVLIAPKATPPVCKIIDYGKYRYELARKEKDAKKKQKTVEEKKATRKANSALLANWSVIHLIHGRRKTLLPQQRKQ